MALCTGWRCREWLRWLSEANPARLMARSNSASQNPRAFSSTAVAQGLLRVDLWGLSTGDGRSARSCSGSGDYRMKRLLAPVPGAMRLVFAPFLVTAVGSCGDQATRSDRDTAGHWNSRHRHPKHRPHVGSPKSHGVPSEPESARGGEADRVEEPSPRPESRPEAEQSSGSSAESPQPETQPETPPQPETLVEPEPVDPAAEPAEPRRGDPPYDLGPLPAIVRDVEWPREPEPSSTVNVSNDTQFQAALSRDGVRVRVAAGSYRSANVSCRNCEFVLDQGATVNGSLTFSGSRIRWLGGRVEGGPVNQTGAGDLLIDGLYARTNGRINNFSGPAAAPWNRVALVNTTLEVFNGSESGTWAFYIQRAADGVPFRGRNLILANVRLESDGQNNRINSVENLVVVDSYYNSNLTSYNGLRLHFGIRDMYMRDTIIVGSNITCCGSPAPTQIINGVFERVTRYSELSNAFSVGIGRLTQNVTINDCETFSTGGVSGYGIGSPPELGVATGTNPPVRLWDGATVPDGFPYGRR